VGAVFALAAGSFIAGGWRAARSAWREGRRRRAGVDLLMIVAALGSTLVGFWHEGAVLLFLFSLSGALEYYVFQRTRRGVTSLMNLRPDRATVVRDGVETQVAVAALRLGDVIRVRPGERFPVDGEVVEGAAAVDESIITGEPLPVEKTPGSPIFAGSIDTNGSLLVRMTKAAGESMLDKIVRLVELAQERKAPVQRMIERWESPFVLGVLGLSLVTLLATLVATGGAFSAALYESMVVLVAASPCAVVIASPAAVLAAVTRGAGLGILFKGGSHIEHLATAGCFAFDKTGTLTEGRPVLQEIHPAPGVDEERLLALAAGLELHSEHPIARAIVRAATERGVELERVDSFVRESGIGIFGTRNGRWMGVGNERLFARHGLELPESLRSTTADEAGQIRVIAAEKGGAAGVLILADRLRPDAVDCLQALRGLGVEHFILATGDRPEPARKVAEILGIDEVHAGLLPEEKMRIILRARDRGVVMVGDGVNDAPALAAASVGIAMGAAGTDVALENADIVLMRDELSGLPHALKLARACRRTIQQSLAFAMGMIALLILLTLSVNLPLSMAVVGHEGGTVLVALNGLRLLRLDMDDG
jgi:Cd2+/Zn2+-exporting ATPase